MIRVAFIYSKKNYFISGKHFDNHWYYFFMKALKRNSNIKVDYIAEENEIDCMTLKGKYDIILSYSTHLEFSPHYKNIKECGIPSLFMSGDPHGYEGQKKLIKEYGIKNFFFMSSSEYFYKFWPKDLHYTQIVFGLEYPLYFRDMSNWKKRISNFILNTGNTIPYNVEAQKHYYKLRALCNSHSRVEYISKTDGYLAEKFPDLLCMYKTAIAAATPCITLKFLEIAAAGCLTFMEVNGKNGAETLGFQEGVNCITINEYTYKQKFDEYIKYPDDPKWEEIARLGQKHVRYNFNNDIAIRKLIDTMERIVRGE